MTHNIKLKFIGICLHHHAAFDEAKSEIHYNDYNNRLDFSARWLRAEFGPAQLMLDESDATPIKRYPLFHLHEIATYIKAPSKALSDINASFPPELHELSTLTDTRTYESSAAQDIGTEFRKANGQLKLAIIRYARGAYNLTDFQRPTQVRDPHLPSLTRNRLREWETGLMGNIPLPRPLPTKRIPKI